MFDIGFSELLLVGLVSLLVFGPERLPRVARELAFWVRKARSAVASVRAEIDHELHLQDLRDSVKLNNLPARGESWRSYEGRVLDGEVVDPDKHSEAKDRKKEEGDGSHQ